uniref:Uncharacterized protein n=1 Tax=Romanomermis culicivorax TaxID=13658 RepID=A0A915IUM1_ROMCU
MIVMRSPDSASAVRAITNLEECSFATNLHTMYSKWIFSTTWSIFAGKLIKFLLFLWIFSNEQAQCSDYRRMDGSSLKPDLYKAGPVCSTMLYVM